MPSISFSVQDQTFFIQGPAGALELVLRAAAAPVPRSPLALICHPHPQHGGTMDNKVVTTLARAYRDSGYDSIRFNFRGVGRSEGEYGELHGEIDDLEAVMAWARRSFPGRSFLLAGFSFGSAVAAQVAGRAEGVAHLIMVASPVGKYDLVYPDRFPCPVLVVQGAQDEVVDLEATRRWAARGEGDFRYQELGAAGHFFHGQLTALAALVRDELERFAAGSEL